MILSSSREHSASQSRFSLLDRLEKLSHWIASDFIDEPASKINRWLVMLSAECQNGVNLCDSYITNYEAIREVAKNVYIIVRGSRVMEHRIFEIWINNDNTNVMMRLYSWQRWRDLEKHRA